MPYIEEGRREPLGGQCRSIGSSVQNPGELNYAITQMILGYLGKGISYTTLNSIMGVLSCVARELYRRVVVPYEEVKRETHGDVF